MARAWFLQENTHGLTDSDLQVLNRAVRNSFPVGAKPSHLDLMHFRGAYKPGMSAHDLIEAVYEQGNA